MRRNRRVSMALVGLLVLSVFSLTTASGRRADEDTRGKPAEKVKVSLRRISSSETMDILQKFPEMVPSYLASRKDDRELLTSVFRFSEVTAAPLRRAFPAARFYEYQGFTSPPYPYLMAIAGDKRYMMPGNFNRLLVDNGQKVTHKNIVELAQAFVLQAVGSEPIFGRTDTPLGLDTLPPIAFLEATKAKHVINTVRFDIKLKVRIGELVEEWYFEIWRSQFREVFRMNNGGLIKEYLLGVNELQEHGRLNNVPRIVIDTAPRSAYVEYDTAQNPHYYATVDTNGHSTNDTVTFHLSGFPPESANVFVRVRDDIRGVIRLLHKVQMSSGSGSYSWPAPIVSTGISIAGAGYAYDTLRPDTSYHEATDTLRELTLEKVIDTTFPGSSELLKVYYCDQFFKDDTTHGRGGESYAPIFAQYAQNAMLESWRTQTDSWQLGT